MTERAALGRLTKARGFLMRFAWELELLEHLLPDDAPELRDMVERAEEMRGELGGLAAGCGEDEDPQMTKVGQEWRRTL